MTLQDNFPKTFPAQHQNSQPGMEGLMNPSPIFELECSKENKRLKDKVAIITGGDSGIGRAVALSYAREGAMVVIVYLNEDEDAKKTCDLITTKGGKAFLLKGDIGEEDFCKNVINQVMKEFGKIDILVNNAGEQHCQNNIEDISKSQIERTFKTNFFGPFFLTKAAVPNMKRGASIINTTSVTAYKGHETLIDYSCTKGALTSFTRSLALNLATKGIRVNAVAPGPIWTPLIPASFDEQKVTEFGSDSGMKRAGQPAEVAEAYVFLASDYASYITGETIHVNGGEIING